MINLKDFCNNIQPVNENLWQSKTSAELSKSAKPVSYQSDGHQEYRQIEDTSFWFHHRNKCIVQVVSHFAPKGPIFDLGAGNGYVSLAFQQQGFESIVVEPGVVGAQNAIDRGLKPVICSSFENAGFMAGALPAVGLFDVVEHTERDVDFLKSVYEAVATDGFIYITVPAYQWLWSKEDVSAGHFRRYKKKEIESVIQRAGFTVCYSTYFFTWLILPIFLMRTIPSYFGFDVSVGNNDVSDSTSSAKKPSSIQKLLKKLFSFELKFIAGNDSAHASNKSSVVRFIPFGSSVLVVARKTN